MLRLVNDTNGFTDRYTTNMGIITPDYYPPQDTRYVGYWTTLRFRSEYDYTDFVNNRFFIEPKKKFDPEVYNYKNDGEIHYFQVLRFDLEAPFKAILCTERNEVIVTDTQTLQSIIDLESLFLAKNIVAMRLKGRKYVSFNVVQDENEFFDSYRNEEVHIYPIQNDEMFGLPVMIEYDKDLDKDHSYNEANLHTFVDPQGNEIVYRDGEGWRYVDNGDEFSGVPTYWWNNQFPYTERMTAAQIERNRLLGAYPVSVLRSFEHYYNVHAKSIVDKPRRHKTLGVIIRIDVNATEPEVVVMEFLDTGYVRFICQDEARFFYNTSIDIPNPKFNILNTVKEHKLTRF